MKKRTPLFLTATVALASACAHGGMHAEHHGGGHESHAGGHAHWSYAGETGPANWGTLSADYALCATGKEQSPVDVNPSLVAMAGDPIEFSYRPAPVDLLNNGHTIQQNYASGSSISVGGTTYNLVQFHFHTPSENTLGGAHAPMEVHLVHKSATGALAVVGTMLNAAEGADALAPVADNIPAESGQTRHDAARTVNAADLLPTDRKTFRFRGSLTTPPCTEGVSWLLMAQPVTVPQKTLDALARAMGTNNRPVQPLHARVIDARLP